MRMSEISRRILEDGKTQRGEMPALTDGLRRGGVVKAELGALSGPQFIETLEAGVGDSIYQLAKQNGTKITFDLPIEAHDLEVVKAKIEDGAIFKRGQQNDKISMEL